MYGSWLVVWAVAACISNVHCSPVTQSLHAPVSETQKLKNEVAELRAMLNQMNASFTAMKSKMDMQSNTVYAFYAYSTRTQYLSTQQPFVFDYIETNKGNCYDTRSGKFTAPVRGLYYFAANLMAEPGNYIHIEIVRNGRRVSSLFSPDNHSTGNAVLNLILQKGDEVWIRHEAGYENRAVVSRTYAMFSGYLITQNI